jgi:hypothetical protein
VSSSIPRNAGTGDIDALSQFQLKQYESLRREIEWNLDQLRKLELYAVIATGAIWGFVVGKWDFFLLYPALMIAAAALPIPLILCGYFRYRGTIESIERIAGYIREHIERQFACNGWEHYLHGPAGKGKWRWVKRSERIVWFGLLAINLTNVAVVAFYSNEARAARIQTERHLTAPSK